MMMMMMPPWPLLLPLLLLPRSGSGAEEVAPSASAAPSSSASSTTKPAAAEAAEPLLEHARTLLPSQSEPAAAQPVLGIGQRVKAPRSDKKKDLGTLGYVLGLLMVMILIAIGAGVVLGYVYKRGKDLKEQHQQKVYEREMQRITLPLSAFTNAACELVDENTIVVHTNQTPVEESHNGDAPLMGQAGTPGA